MTYPAEVLADSPLVYWRLGEASGTTAADASGDGHTGTYTNGPTLGVAGLLTGDADTAVEFVKADATALIGDDTPVAAGTLAAFAVECIFEMPATGGGQLVVLADPANTTDIIELYAEEDLIGFDFQGTSAYSPSCEVSGVAPGARHIVAVFDGTQLLLYIDGVEAATEAFVDAGAVQTVDNQLTVGNYAISFSLDPAIDGVLDEVAFYDHDLSPTRVAVHASAGGFTPGASQNVVLPLLSTGTRYAPHIFRSGEVTLPRLNAAPVLNAPGVGRPTTPTGASPALYVVKMCDPSGGNATTLASAQPEDVTWTLNQPTEATITWPKPAYTAAQIPTFGTVAGVREVQIYRDDDLMFKGRMIQPEGAGSRGEITGHCADRLWVLYHGRNIDAPQFNHILNGSFESAFSNWSHFGSFTATTDSTRKVLGTQSAKFVNATANEDAFKLQNFQIGPNGVGCLVTVSAWIFIESITANALGARGLYIEGGPNNTVQDLNYRALDYQDETLPHEIWIPPEGLQGAPGFVTTLWVPPNQIWDMNVRLYAPQGTVWWDAVLDVTMDSIGSTTETGSASSEADIADITRVLVNHVQNPAMGKSHEFVGTHCPANGVKLFRQYQFVDHVNFEQAVSEFTQRDDGFDVSLEETPTTTSFHTWTPNKGTDRSGSVTLTYGGNVADYRWSKDGPGCVTRETVTGEGSGVARQEAEYADASQIGGTILQEVRQAPPETQINSLLPIATEQVNKRGTPPLLLELDVLPSAGLIHTLKVGDWITAVVSDGYVQVSGKHRIVKMKLTCRTNVLTVFVNEDL